MARLEDSWIQLEETHDLTPYQVPMQPIPDRVEDAIAAGAQTAPVVELGDASKLIDVGGAGDGLQDGVVRHPNGQLVVACLTEMPGVSSAMWNWWFSWHGYTSERYRLWHPEAHLVAALAEDRRTEPRVRDRWVGNTSYVDEYIGDSLLRLAIRFVPPAEVGLDEDAVDRIGVAICARTALRRERLAAGHLIHLVEDTDDGCRMHSRFWLGDASSEVPYVGRGIDRVVNQPKVRRRLLPDVAGLALLRHCSEEMNHLARILPDLFDQFGSDDGPDAGR